MTLVNIPAQITTTLQTFFRAARKIHLQSQHFPTKRHANMNFPGMPPGMPGGGQQGQGGMSSQEMQQVAMVSFSSIERESERDYPRKEDEETVANLMVNE